MYQSNQETLFNYQNVKINIADFFLPLLGGKKRDKLTSSGGLQLGRLIKYEQKMGKTNKLQRLIYIYIHEDHPFAHITPN